MTVGTPSRPALAIYDGRTRLGTIEPVGSRYAVTNAVGARLGTFDTYAAALAAVNQRRPEAGR